MGADILVRVKRWPFLGFITCHFLCPKCDFYVSETKKVLPQNHWLALQVVGLLTVAYEKWQKLRCDHSISLPCGDHLLFTGRQAERELQYVVRAQIFLRLKSLWILLMIVTISSFNIFCLKFLFKPRGLFFSEPYPLFLLLLTITIFAFACWFWTTLTKIAFRNTKETIEEEKARENLGILLKPDTTSFMLNKGGEGYKKNCLDLCCICCQLGFLLKGEKWKIVIWRMAPIVTFAFCGDIII